MEKTRKMNQPKKYLINDVLVEAVKTEGGGFYDVTVVATGNKLRCVAEVFEKNAKLYREKK